MMDPNSPFAAYNVSPSGRPESQKIDTRVISVFFCGHTNCCALWKAPAAESCLYCKRHDKLEVLKTYRVDPPRI